MTKSEYQELVEYLGEMFGRMDTRFKAIEERLVRAEVAVESMRNETVRAVPIGPS